MSSSNEYVVAVDSSVEPAKMNESKKLRKWTKIDATGHIETMELDNYTIRQRVHISVRDLRILDRDDTYPSTILAREKAILFNVTELKMIITAKEVLILEDWTSTDYPARFRQRLVDMMLSPETNSDTENELPFEFCALKLALESFYNFVNGERESQGLSCVIEFPSVFDIGLMNDDIHHKKRQLNNFTVNVQKVSDEIKRLLENEPGLAEFYLSRKLARASSSSGEPILNPTSHVVDNDVDELQMLLEKHFYKIKSITIELCQLKDRIDYVEIYANTKLDEIRNRLIKFDLIISSASICLSVFSLVAGILGMNIPFSWNNQKDMFKWVVSVTGTICAILFVIIMSYARHKRLIGWFF